MLLHGVMAESFGALPWLECGIVVVSIGLVVRSFN